MVDWNQLLMATLGHNIRELRKSRNWTQAALAEKLDVTRVTIARIELGVTMPDWSFVCRAADEFEVTTEYLRKPQKKVAVSA